MVVISKMSLFIFILITSLIVVVLYFKFACLFYSRSEMYRLSYWGYLEKRLIKMVGIFTATFFGLYLIFGEFIIDKFITLK